MSRLTQITGGPLLDASHSGHDLSVSAATIVYEYIELTKP